MNKIVLLLSTLFPTLVFAHEEHGPTIMENIWHVLASPEHAWPLSIALALTVIVVCIQARS